MEFNYQSIAKELVIALRKNRTSVEVSKLMGFSFNQVRRWEAGEKQLRWDEFCDYCNVLEVPLLEAINNSYVYGPADPKDFPGFLRSVVYPYLSVEQIAQRLYRHPSAIRRYLEGEVYPDLEFILAFIHLDHMRLPQLVMDILPANYHSSLRSQLEEYVYHIERTREQPILCAVKHWLETKVYEDLPAHDDDFIAKRVGCTTTEARRHLAELVRIGGAKIGENGKYVPQLIYTQVGRSNKKIVRDFHAHWFGQIARYYASNSNPLKGFIGIESSRIATATRNQAERINEIFARVDAEILGILMEEQSEPIEDVRLILFGSHSLQDIYSEE